MLNRRIRTLPRSIDTYIAMLAAQRRADHDLMLKSYASLTNLRRTPPPYYKSKMIQLIPCSFLSRTLHLVVALHCLRVARRCLIARSSLWWRLHKPILLTRKLRVRSIRHRAVALLCSSAARSILWLPVYVVVCDMSALCIVCWYLLVGRIRRYSNDVPGVQ